MMMDSLKALKAGLSDRTRHHGCFASTAFQQSRKNLETLLEYFDRRMTGSLTFNSQLEPPICFNQSFVQPATDVYHESEPHLYSTPQVTTLSPSNMNIPTSAQHSKRVRMSRDSSYASSSSQSPSKQRAEAPFFSPFAISEPADILNGFACLNQSWDASFDGLAFGMDGFHGGEV